MKLILKLEAEPYSMIEDVCYEAVRLAGKLDVLVEVIHEGFKILAEPGDDPRELVKMVYGAWKQ